MTTTPTPSRARTALVTGAATAAYYATPDVVRSRTQRAWVKAALLALLAAESVPDLQAAVAAGRAARATTASDTTQDDPTTPGAGVATTADTDDTDDTDDNTLRDDDAVGPAPESVGLAALPRSGKVAAAAVAAVLIGVTTALTVATERWIFRRGEARAAAGARLPHTRTGLLLGLLSAGLALVPSPDDDAPGPGSTGGSAPA